MGLFDKIKNEFIDIIEWNDETNDTIVWKFPRYQNEIKMKAKLTVRESQQAVFLNEGKLADVFEPGMYTLETQNMPILATLKGWKYGFDSPFKADVFYVSTKQFLDQRWGTKNAITIDDERFGMIELRAFGSFAYRVTDAAKFLKEVSGTDSEFTTDEINGQLRSLIMSKFSNLVGSGKIPIDKIAANIDDLSKLCHEKISEDFEEYGLKITKFLLENVSMPDDIKKEIFEYSRLNRIDMQKLTQFKAANSIEAAVSNPGMGGMGVGMGVGMGMGNMVANSMSQAMNNPQATPPAGGTPPPLPQASAYFVAVNGQQNGPYTTDVLSSMIQNGTFKRDSKVWKNGMANWMDAGSVDELGALFQNEPPPLPPM
jgi:membrane protease subunit (stomatin/prohibitin family)